MRVTVAQIPLDVDFQLLVTKTFTNLGDFFFFSYIFPKGKHFLKILIFLKSSSTWRCKEVEVLKEKECRVQNENPLKGNTFGSSKVGLDLICYTLKVIIQVLDLCAGFQSIFLKSYVMEDFAWVYMPMLLHRRARNWCSVISYISVCTPL